MEVYFEFSEKYEGGVVVIETTTKIFSKDGTAAIVISDDRFLFLNLKTKQGKTIGTTRKEAMEQLRNMGKIDDFPNI